MAVETTLIDIIARLRQGRFQNEQAVSQGIVLPILRELGRDIFDTTHVWPEYQTGEGRADFALCHPPSRPAELIEVKPPGKAEDGVRQALELANELLNAITKTFATAEDSYPRKEVIA